MERFNVVESLCEGQSPEVRRMIMSAYWAGCAEGMEVRELMDTAERTAREAARLASRTSGNNVVQLKDYRKG